ncbi:MAG TPA: hypothetical protein VGK92_06190 [Gaiellales bacterium]
MSAPDPFAGLVGNESARARLRVALDHPGHAYLLIGRHGYGVGAHARRFAAALAGLPERTLEGGHPDLLEVRPEGTQIRIDQVRELWRDIQLRPFSAERRVYLIWDAETMPEVVQNALLKSIEEPPGHAVVILVCAQPHRLLATVRSRCEQVRFAPLAAVEVATALELGGPAGLALARASGGDLDRARELLEGGEASDRRERYLALARSAYADERFDPGAAARAVAEACTARGSEARAAAEAEAARRVEALGDHPPRAEASRVRREGEALAKRRGRAAEVEEARAAVETFVTWYRDLLAAALGADDTLVHSDHREQVATDAASGREALAARCLEAARDTRRALELTITPTLALEALFHRLRTIARAEQANA